MNHNLAHGAETAAIAGVLGGAMRVRGGMLKLIYLGYLLVRTVGLGGLVALFTDELVLVVIGAIALSLTWAAWNNFQSWRRFLLVKPYLEAFLATGRDEFLSVLQPAHMTFSLASLEEQEPIMPVAEYHFDAGGKQRGVVTDNMRCMGMLGNLIAPVWWIRLQIRQREREFLKTGEIKKRKGVVFKTWLTLVVIAIAAEVYNKSYLAEPIVHISEFLLFAIFAGFIPGIAVGVLHYIWRTFIRGDRRYGRLFDGVGTPRKVDYELAW